MTHVVNPSSTDRGSDNGPWYAGISRYQWLVLVVACLGWVFDQFESQIFVASMNEAIPSLVARDVKPSTISFYNDVALGAFLLGGAIGGVGFGILSDRIGRAKALSLTILFYSAFTCISAFATAWWELALFRFLVALGVGGEWAVASTLVAEEFPRRARAHVGAILHATSVFGTYLAVLAGLLILGNPAIARYAEDLGVPSLTWRIGFAIGALPALLILWVRRSLKEPESWLMARASGSAQDPRLGSLRELFSPPWRRPAILAMLLAAVGLATFWGTHIRGKDLLRAAVQQEMATENRDDDTPESNALIKRWEMLGMFLVTTGGGIGLVSFGPICQQIGRRPAFLLFHLGGFLASVVLFTSHLGRGPLLFALPVFGYLTLGMHAGYAVYFPELFPTRLRSTGTGFCFNAGRILAAPLMFTRGWMQKDWGYSLEGASLTMSMLFLVGAFLLLGLPETKGRSLPE